MTERACRHGHVGWMYQRFMWHGNRQASYWCWVCRECERLSNPLSESRPTAAHQRGASGMPRLNGQSGTHHCPDCRCVLRAHRTRRGMCHRCYQRRWQLGEFVKDETIPASSLGICPRCETRPVRPRRSYRHTYESCCGKCAAAADALARYWREIGMPLRWAERRPRTRLAVIRKIAA